MSARTDRGVGTAWDVTFVRIAIGAVLAGLTFGLTLSLVGCGEPIPDLRGQGLGAAKEAALKAGYRIAAVSYDDTAQGEWLAVTRQKPEPGMNLAGGKAIDVTLVGPAPVKVPSLAGLGTAEASAALRATGLLLGVVTGSHDPTVPAGAVISQQPAAGAQVRPGTAVTVVASTGRAPVAVPGVVGKTLSVARASLQGAGFVVVTTTKDGPAKADTVLSQSVKAGAMLRPGATITLSLASGWTKVPDLWKESQKHHFRYDYLFSGESTLSDAEIAANNDKYWAELTSVVRAIAQKAGLRLAKVDSAPLTSKQVPHVGSRVKVGTWVMLTVGIAD
jgi:beta-lactam-binding protein with PASTA domain